MTHDVQRRIEQEMLRLFRDAVSTRELRAIGSPLIDYIEAYIARPAKRIRPWLLATTARAFDVTDEAAVLRIGAATELLHVFALMHDDRLDSEERISAWSVPEKPERAYQLLGGDILHSIAIHSLHDTIAEFSLSREIIETVRSVSLTTIAGQASDIAFADPSAPAPSLSRLYSLYDVKTGQYSFVAPLMIGAILGEAPEADRATLSELGRTLGRVYQMRDDAADTRRHIARVEAGETTVPGWEFNLLTTFLLETRGIDVRDAQRSGNYRRTLLSHADPDAMQSFVYEITDREVAGCMENIEALGVSGSGKRLLREAIASLDRITRAADVPSRKR
ncbi:MAG: polyprenyl synthetase family protein [Spirochaetales bacterium]